MRERLVNLQASDRKRRVVPSRHHLAFVLTCAVSVSSIQSDPHFTSSIRQKATVPDRASEFLKQKIVGGSTIDNEQKVSTVHNERAGNQVQETTLGNKNEAALKANTSSQQDANKLPSATSETLSAWPCFDELDKMLIKIALPVIATFAIQPIVSAADLFFINRLGNALAVAGQSAANQVFGSVFWLTSFLPSITAILVSKEFSKGNKEGVQEAVCQALLVGIIFAAIGSCGLLLYPEKVLRAVLKSKL